MTESAVLVLNRHFQPIHVTNAKRAFSLLYLGVARVIDREFKTFDFESWAQLSDEMAAANGEVIKTVNRAIRVPRVIVLQLYDRIRRPRSASRATTSTCATGTPASTAARSCRGRS